MGSGERQAVETIRIGQRVSAFADDRRGPSLDPALHRVIRLQFVDAGRELIISYLRSAKVAEGLGVGDTIPIDLMEVEARGKATVIGIDPCPDLEEGPGQLVTAVLSSDGLHLQWLKLKGLAEPIGVTSNHPIYSEDRMAFVPAGQLHEDEKLRTRTGTVEVESITPMPGRHRVYNMEIGSVHQYYVSDVLLLVHNENSDGTGEGPVPPGASPALPDSPYNPDTVDARIKPPYEVNPAHDEGTQFYNPAKGPEPLDAAEVYKGTAVRGGMKTWYGKNSSGDIYRYFSDNAGHVHFSGSTGAATNPLSLNEVPIAVKRFFGVKG